MTRPTIIGVGHAGRRERAVYGNMWCR